MADNAGERFEHRNISAEVIGANALSDWLSAITPKKAREDGPQAMNPGGKHQLEVWQKTIGFLTGEGSDA